MSTPILAAGPAQAWLAKLSSYRQPDVARGIFELAVTVVPFAAAWAAMVAALHLHQFWLIGLLLVPTAGLVTRLFMIQHDCGHGSFFPGRAANDWTGRLIGILTLTPYDYWRRSHAIHHATSGHLGRRGVGDVSTLTVREYLARSPWGKLRYRMYRHPAVMFGLGPAYLFVVQFRLPLGLMHRRQSWMSTMGTNLSLVGVVSLVAWACGPSALLLVHLPIVLLAATGGVWLFYVQHQFEQTHWADDPAWSVHEAALHGSSHYDLPCVLRWFTGNIGVHHVHHLASRIPFYRLQKVLQDHPELRGIGRLTLWESFACVRLVLWDEASKRLISFKEAAAQRSLRVSVPQGT